MVTYRKWVKNQPRQHMITTENTTCLKYPIHEKSSFREKKNVVIPIDKISIDLLYNKGMRWCYSTLLINQFPLFHLPSGRLLKAKTKSKFQTLALRVVEVAQERWKLTRGFRYIDMNWKLSYFGKLVTEERWSLTRSDGSRSPDFTYSRNIKIPGLLHIRIPLIFFFRICG